MFFSTTFFRVATPYRHMSWADFLLADILTSLAKPLSDCERALCHLLSGPVMLPHSTDQVGSQHLIISEGSTTLEHHQRMSCRCAEAAHGSSQQDYACHTSGDFVSAYAHGKTRVIQGKPSMLSSTAQHFPLSFSLQSTSKSLRRTGTSSGNHCV